MVFPFPLPAYGTCQNFLRDKKSELEEKWSPLWCAVPVDHSLGLHSEHSLTVHYVECRTLFPGFEHLTFSFQGQILILFSMIDFLKRSKFGHVPYRQEDGKGKGKTKSTLCGANCLELGGIAAMLAQSYQWTLPCKTVGVRNRVVGGALAVQAICSDCTGRPFG